MIQHGGNQALNNNGQERKHSYNNIKESTCCLMINFEEWSENKHTHKEAISQIPTFLQPGKRSSHMNHGGFAKKLVFTSCCKATEGERGRDRARRGGWCSHSSTALSLVRISPLTWLSLSSHHHLLLCSFWAKDQEPTPRTTSIPFTAPLSGSRRLVFVCKEGGRQTAGEARGRMWG